MAHFRAVIQGQRGAASRLGSKSSGIYARVQSWGYDVVVNARHDAGKGQDWATVEVVDHCTGFAVSVLDVNMTTGRAYARKETDRAILQIGPVNAQLGEF